MSTAEILKNTEILQKEYESSNCYICADKNATVFCAVPNCQRAFHVICGEKEHCLMQYAEPYDAYCSEHHGLLETPSASLECRSCLELFNEQERSPVDFIPSCCYQGWYHRRCIRKQAYFSGDNMKCPSCGYKGVDRANFQHFIQTRGVYIPKRSALYPLQLEKKEINEKERHI